MKRPARFPRGALPRRLLVLGLLASGCGQAVTGGEVAGLAELQISPRTTSVLAGGGASFTVTVAGDPIAGAEWSASAGSITSTGVFTAPAQPGSYQIYAAYQGQTAVATANVVAPGAPGAFYAAAVSACSTMPLRSTGTVRYFCDCQAGAQSGCVAGSDSNPGTVASAPKQTWSAAIAAFNAMNAGDTIALCRGGAWAVTSSSPADCSNQLTNARCAAGASLTDPTNTSTCDLRDYEPSWGGTAKPLIRASSSSATRLLSRYAGSTNGVRILNLAFQGGNAGPNGGVYYDHRAIGSGLCSPVADSSWLICNNDFDRFRIAMNAANTGTMSSFLIWGNRFTMNDLDAFLGGAGANNRIDANVFDNNGGFMHPITGNLGHTVYITRLSNPTSTVSTNMAIVNNQFLRSGAGGTVGPCASPTLVGHAQWDGVNVENNFHDGGAGVTANCWAIDLRAAGSDPTYFRNMAIRRNWISSGVGISVGQAPGVVIENNVVALVGSNTWKHGIMSPMDVARSGLDDVQNGTTIRNNTIYFSGGDASFSGVLAGTEGTGHVIANNAVYTGGGTCFSTPLASGAYAFVGNNACFGGTWGTAYDATTHVTSDPMFTSPGTDFTPLSGSPLSGAGSAAYAPSTDYSLNTRPNPPSIGAFEP